MTNALRRLAGGIVLTLAVGFPNAATGQSLTIYLPTGAICFNQLLQIVSCPEPAPSDGKAKPKLPKGDDDKEESPWDDDASKSPWHTDDNPFNIGFCSECHVQSSSQVWGPQSVAREVLDNTGLFWERHGELARRVDDRDRLRTVRELTALSPDMRRLVEEVRRTSRPRHQR